MPVDAERPDGVVEPSATPTEEVDPRRRTRVLWPRDRPRGVLLAVAAIAVLIALFLLLA